MSDPEILRIAALNDELRTHLTATPNSRVVLTTALNGHIDELAQSIPRQDVLTQLLSQIRNFRFPEYDDNDERNFGAFEFYGERIIFKIDYYDLALKFASERPYDRDHTVRVMTIMLSQDY